MELELDFVLPPLYKRIKTGRIQQWGVVVEGRTFYTIEGLVDGKLTSSIPTVCSGKNIGRANETSGREQAIKEAKALWQKKVNQSYNVDITKCDLKKYFELMLAEKYEDYKHLITYPIFSQPKLDGIRCTSEIKGLWSRNGKPFVSCNHIYKILESRFKRYPGIRFDGELYCDKYKNDFNQITSYVRTSKSLTPEKLEAISNNLEYWIYDLPSHPGVTEDRINALNALFPDPVKGIVIVPTLKVFNLEELNNVYYDYLENGIEGQIIRFNTPYENFRTQNLLKRKEFIDDDFVIVDVLEGKGNRSGTAGKFVLLMKDGRTFESNIKGNFSYLREVLRNKKNLIGKITTVRYGRLTPAGKPRFGYAVAIRDYE